MSDEREQQSRQTRIDILLAVAVAGLQIVGTEILREIGGSTEELDPLAYLLVIASAAPLAVRSRYPVAALLAVASVSVIYTWLGYPGPVPVALVFAIWAAVAAGHRLAAALVGIGLVVNIAIAGIMVASSHSREPDAPIWVAGWLVAAFVLGEVSKGRREYLEQVERRATEAERTREEEALRRAGEERLRIARELHDVLAHHISVINVQAGVAVHLLDRQPEQARTALIAINQASKDALRELRATLGVLRQVDDADPRAPTPGLTAIEELVARASSTGLEVDVEIMGERQRLSTGTDLAAYRIVQESLTNVARHAGAKRATVAIEYRSDDLVIEVQDDGRGVPDGAELRAGNGLTGMRERAAAAGGSLEAGPRTEGGFRVRARLPVNGVA